MKSQQNFTCLISCKHISATKTRKKKEGISSLSIAVAESSSGETGPAQIDLYSFILRSFGFKYNSLAFYFSLHSITVATLFGRLLLLFHFEGK